MKSCSRFLRPWSRQWASSEGICTGSQNSMGAIPHEACQRGKPCLFLWYRAAQATSTGCPQSEKTTHGMAENTYESCICQECITNSFYNLQLNDQKKNSPVQKRTKDLNGRFYQEDTQAATQGRVCALLSP